MVLGLIELFDCDFSCLFVVNCLLRTVYVLRLCFIIWLTAFRLVVRFCCWFGVYYWIVCSSFNSVVWFFLFWFYCFIVYLVELVLMFSLWYWLCVGLNGYVCCWGFSFIGFVLVGIWLLGFMWFDLFLLLWVYLLLLWVLCVGCVF